MDEVIEGVHLVHLMNVGQRQAAADPQTKPTDFGRESACRVLLSTFSMDRLSKLTVFSPLLYALFIHYYLELVPPGTLGDELHICKNILMLSIRRMRPWTRSVVRDLIPNLRPLSRRG